MKAEKNGRLSFKGLMVMAGTHNPRFVSSNHSHSGKTGCMLVYKLTEKRQQKMSSRRWSLFIIKWKKYNKKDDQNKYLCRIIWRAKIKVEMRTIPGDVLRPNFIRSTSIFDRRFLVEIEHWALGCHKLNRVLMSTLTIGFYVKISHLLSNTGLCV